MSVSQFIKISIGQYVNDVNSSTTFVLLPSNADVVGPAFDIVVGADPQKTALPSDTDVVGPAFDQVVGADPRRTAFFIAFSYLLTQTWLVLHFTELLGQILGGQPPLSLPLTF